MNNQEIYDFARQFFAEYRILSFHNIIVLDEFRDSFEQICPERNLNFPEDLEKILSSAKTQGLIYPKNNSLNYKFLISPFTASLILRFEEKFIGISELAYNVLEDIKRKRLKNNPICDVLRGFYGI